MTEPAMVGFRRLTVMFQARDHAHHHSLARELLSRARKAHLNGATLFAGLEGVGRSGKYHRQHLLADDAPLALVIVDHRSALARFLEQCEDLLGDELVVLEDLEAFRA
jgi:PII-like signaling protein